MRRQNFDIVLTCGFVEKARVSGHGGCDVDGTTRAAIPYACLCDPSVCRAWVRSAASDAAHSARSDLSSLRRPARRSGHSKFSQRYFQPSLRYRGSARLACVQFLPMLIIPLIILLFPPKYIRGQDLLTVIGCYALSKVCELLDAEIFALGGWVSGHTLKHLVAALATGVLLRSLMKPRIHAEGLK